MSTTKNISRQNGDSLFDAIFSDLTTFREIEYRRMVQKENVTMPGCGRTITEEKVTFDKAGKLNAA